MQEVENDGMEDVIKGRVKLYFQQLTKGCGHRFCENLNCASNAANKSPQKPLERCFELVKNNAPICINKPFKLYQSKIRSLYLFDQDAQALKQYISGCSKQSYFLDFTALTNVFLDECAEIDFDKLVGFFGLFDEDDDLNEYFQKAVFDFVKSLSENKDKRNIFLETRCVIVLLCFPGFEDISRLHDFIEFCSYILSLPKEYKNQLSQWFGKVPLGTVENIIGKLQNAISVEWMEKEEDVDGKKYEAVSPFALVLELIHKSLHNKVDEQLFYNDVVDESVDLQIDYRFYRLRPNLFSATRCAFLLSPASKAEILLLDNHESMMDNVQQSVWRDVMMGQHIIMPFLVLNIRRNNLIEDTILEMQMKSNHDLRNPLKVTFVGEEGVDEGGLQKEFFLLVVRELFDLKYGMFVHRPETHTMWFNKDSFENALQYELIGIIIGLAIYNGVILDIHFPHVVYKKMLRVQPDFDDLNEFDPELYRGLKQLRDFEGDVESTFMSSFSVEYEVFGEIRVDELKENGSNIALTNSNREEYIELYLDYLFNSSIEKQFTAFQIGFEMVCDSPLMKMFSPKELELLVCGIRELSFAGLEEGAQYQDGYDENSPTIKNLWQSVHEMSPENRLKFLAFCTGTDRVPISGLQSLGFTISRNGPDSEILPTAHTCFNHLLLPDYATAAKLKEKLLIAIENYEGFGLR